MAAQYSKSARTGKEQMKKKISNLTKWLAVSITAISLCVALSIGVSAEEADFSKNVSENGESTVVLPENNNEIKETNTNIFDQIYGVLEENADKVFSILAFIGTLAVSVGYKSGLLPLLRDALSKLKLSIDGVRAEGELNKTITAEKMEEISRSIESINRAIDKGNTEISRIEWQFENYEKLMAERGKMRTVLMGQIDMLYAIFMSSALPQYQKDEIGNKIQEMREELASYEESIEK